MNGGPSVAATLAVVMLLAGCGRGSAPRQQAASSQTVGPVAAEPASSTPLATASSDAAPPPTVAAATPRPAALSAPPAPMTVAQMLHDDPALAGRERAPHELYENAHDRDPTGQVERDQQQALSRRQACTDKDCLQHWFNQREAALKAYVQG